MSACKIVAEFEFILSHTGRRCAFWGIAAHAEFFFIERTALLAQALFPKAVRLDLCAGVWTGYACCACS